MLVFNGNKIKDIPKIEKRVLEIWVNGHIVWPEENTDEFEYRLPQELIDKIKSCFALGTWYDGYYWTNNYGWSNTTIEALNYFNELYGKNYELQLVKK